MRAILDLIFGRPRVIVDVCFDRGWFYLVVENIGNRAACNVSVSFDRPLRGVNGSKSINEMALFRDIGFLPPGKDIRAFWDSSAAYFSREAPTEFCADIRYQNERGRRYRTKIRHNLEIYRDLGYICPPDHHPGELAK